MLSSASIRAYAEERAEIARKEGKTPTIVTLEDIQNWPPYPFPFLGDYVPDGWRPVIIDDERLTIQVDLYGQGDGLSWGVDQLNERLRSMAASGDTWAVGILESGEFQLVLGFYKPAYGDFTQSGLLTKQERRDVLAGNPYGRNR